MTPSFSNDPQTNRSLRHSLKDAIAFGTMTGTGETYFSAFALFLKATTPQIGLLASLPPLLASLVQLLSAWIGRLTGQRKAIILAGAGLQALSWIPILTLPLLFPGDAVPLMIGCVVLYQCGANLVTPQWSSLMGDIVPPRRRGRFFALRTRLVTAVTFASLLFGGFVLHRFSRDDNTLTGFVILFGIAACARLVSVYQLSRMHDPKGHVAALEFPFSRSWLSRLRHSNVVRFSVFFALTQFSVSIASPFFTVYMLRDLEFSYLAFTVNTATAIFAQFLTLARWGRISDVFGNRRILAATGILVPLMPILWVFSSNFWYLVAVQAVSGFAWAGFSLSASNFVYDLILPERRATYLAIHNVIASIGIFSGAMLGGYLGAVLPTGIEILGMQFTWLSPLIGVFVISTLARAVVVIALIPKVREVRPVRNISLSQLIFRVTRLNALSGIFFEVVGTKPKAPATGGRATTTTEP
jgi:MFS family permease